MKSIASASRADVLGERLSFYGLQARDPGFRAIGRMLRGALDRPLARFYEKVAVTPAVANMFRDKSAMDKAKTAQMRHWMAIFEDGITADYAQRAQRIGNTHAHLGLAPQWYIGGYAMVAEQVLVRMIAGRIGWFLPWRRRAARQAALFVKVAMLDMDMALTTYFDRSEEQVREIVAERIGAALSALARGDLSQTLSGMPERFASVERDYNAAVSRLRDTVGEVIESVQTIGAGSSEIRSASEDLAQRTEEQAVNVEHSAAAMNALTRMVTDTAQAVDGLNDTLSQTLVQTTTGEAVMTDAVAAMSDIRKASTEIEQVISIIDGIAFQTNLLALNAGVEAARVGAAGEGFAVVAHEVRALAQRSAEAAEQVKGMVRTTLTHVNRGVGLVDDAGRVLRSIVEDVTGLGAVASSIAESSRNQATNIERINATMESMDQMTQQNAAMVEESTAAARAMAGEAERLNDVVARFDTGASANRAEPVPMRRYG